MSSASAQNRFLIAMSGWIASLRARWENKRECSEPPIPKRRYRAVDLASRAERRDPPPFRYPLSAFRNRSGTALIIVLAFVVLLTGLIIAFFSRSIIDRQISNSSANQTKAALFAEGAVDTIVGNLKQEIVLSSSDTPVVTASGTTHIYTPLPFPAQASMLPQLSATTTGITSWAPNFLIRSANNQNFYSGSTNIPSGAISVSSTTPSLNNRYVSLPRWNAHYLLPLAGGTGTTPVTTGSNAFAPPDWVLVARSGTNPTIWNSNMTTSGSNTTTVVGRYAYVIYHEGGLLDVNAAGYPSTTSTNQSAYKPALAYADLTQLGIPALNAVAVDKLVAWRNYASIPAPGPTYTAPGFTATSGSNYYNFVLSNPTGFLKTSGTALNNNGTLGTIGQSDRMFASRQELIKFMQGVNMLGTTGTNLNALNYLTTFSRDLNQPSYIPPATRPKILAANAGGNIATGLDNEFNPSFLTARAKSAFTRNDLSVAVVGEPLVKKRFALSRLAWLTCKGPSAPRATSPDADIGALKNAGVPQAWLQQGTDANILKYFGLKWINTGSAALPANYWLYVHGRNGSNGAIMRLNSPADSKDVARLNPGRDADFFELLKAGINAGSLGKVGSSVPTGGGNILSLYNQYYSDYSVDNQIIQIGADIIDQFDSDNFPTRIVFDDGSNPPTPYAGIENLPYLYRVHPAVVKVMPPKVASDKTANGNPGLYYGTGDALTGNQQITETGLGALILIPELWNPHDWCGDNATKAQMDQTMGTMGPQDFEIFAQSDVPVVVKAGTYNGALFGGMDNFNKGGDATINPGYPNRGFPWAGNPRKISESNSKMLFQITPDATGAQLFREPTVLYRPNKPTGSIMSAPGLSTAPAIVLSGGSLVAKVGDGGIYNSGPPNYPGPPIVGQSYIGMYLGTVPLIWRTAAAKPAVTGTTWRASTVVLDNGDPGALFTFNLQCKDAFGTLVTYDQKKTSIGHWGEGYGRIARPMHAAWAGLLQPCRDGDREYFVLDPRTSRFGFQYLSPEMGDGQQAEQLKWSFAPFSYSHLLVNRAAGWVPVDCSWLSRDEGIMGSIRNGWGNGSAGQAIDNNIAWHGLNPYNFPKSMGFYPGNQGNNTVWTWNDASNANRPGLFAENDGAPTYNYQIAGDVQHYAGEAATNAGQYYADADGVVRRGMGGWTDARTSFIGPPNLSVYRVNKIYGQVTGLPMRVAHKLGSDNKLHKTDLELNYPPSGPSASFLQAEARPMILNRPFRSVAELGYTFSGTPWKNLNLEMPESGDSALLDVFCVNDTDDSRGLAAGKVNLNTRQVPVLKAIIAGAYKSDWSASSTATSGTLADIQANRLVARTTGIVPAAVTVSGTGARPLQNISDLVGRWVSPKTPGPNPAGASAPGPYGPTSYDGYSADLLNPLYFTDWTKKTPYPDATDDPNNTNAVLLDKTISRRRAAPLRALANAGQTRLWNLMIDLVAQTGRYPQSAGALDKFVVEGEQRYWVHVAIDRLTGEVVDKQIEVVKE